MAHRCISYHLSSTKPSNRLVFIFHNHSYLHWRSSMSKTERTISRRLYSIHLPNGHRARPGWRTCQPAGGTAPGAKFTPGYRLHLPGFPQGQWRQPPEANTCDFRFGLWDALTDGNQIGIDDEVTGVLVSRWLFHRPGQRVQPLHQCCLQRSSAVGSR